MRIDVKQELYTSKSSRLIDKHVLILVTGSVAIFKTPDIIRELIRHGAGVDVMLSPEAAKLVSPTVFEWASGRKVQLDITGNVEHVLFAGEHSQKVDLIIVCPLTASTLGKFVHGISDTNVTLTLMTALGSKIPILLVPGMHEPMFKNEFVQDNITKVKQIPTVTFLEPRIEEHKAKVPELQTIIAWSIKLLTPQSFHGKFVLITGGPNHEYFDRVRFIGNPSSGKTGLALAFEAWYLGASVSFIVGPNSLDIPSLFKVTQVTSSSDMADAVLAELQKEKFSLAIFSAAVADFTPVSFTDDKIRSTNQELTISLKPTPKILQLVKDFKKSTNRPDLYVVGYKAEYNKTKDELQKIVAKYLSNDLANLVVANLIGSKTTGFEVDSSQVHVFTSQDYYFLEGPKTMIAHDLLSTILSKMN